MDTRQRDVIKEERKESKWNAQRERVRVRAVGWTLGRFISIHRK